jgi:acyl-CoA dehydrogenase
MQSAGRTAAEVPLLEAAVARWLFAQAGLPQPDDLVLLAQRDPRTGEIVIPFGRAAARACVADFRGAPTLTVLAVAPDRLVMGEDLAGEPRDRMALPAETTTHPLAVSGDRVAGLCALLRAAQMAGAMEQILAIAIEHANTRSQFGRTLSQFQAVQQMLSELAGYVAVVAAAVDGACAPMRDDNAWIGGAFAKARASEAVARVNANGHQVTAAMVFTREFALHRFTRRLWAWRDEFGSEHVWHQRLGALALAAGGERLWAFLSDPDAHARAA